MPKDTPANDNEQSLLKRGSKAANNNLPEAFREQFAAEDKANRQIVDNALKALANSDVSKEVTHGPAQEKLTRQRDLDAHDRLLMRGSAEASRDTLHDNGPGKEPGAYTTYEARDRAAHTPAAHTIDPEK